MNIRLISLYNLDCKLIVLLFLKENSDGEIGKKITIFADKNNLKELKAVMGEIKPLPFSFIDYTYFEEKLFKWGKTKGIKGYLTTPLLDSGYDNYSQIKSRILTQSGKNLDKEDVTWKLTT